ncbi:MAG: biopolymer transporter ExbD, partial [Acidobacteria bacterium]|nr:biopolymer transporter ExbD [Acidobacteriota bacterium]
PMLQKGVSVQMARALNPQSMPDADKEDAVLVAVTRDGNIFLGREQIELKDLAEGVREMIATRVDKTVYIKSDARAKFQQVVRAVNEIRSVGVDKLGLITEKVTAEQMVRQLTPL